MDAEIISIGDELSSGQRLDTNSQWIAQQLSDLGVRALFHTTIADDLAANIEAFQIASRRVDIVICTGGLGPTKDDLTREALGAAFNLPLQEYPEALQHIENLFRNRQRPMPERNKVQALFPQSSRIIPNPHGTAPGIDLIVNADHSTNAFNQYSSEIPSSSDSGKYQEPISNPKRTCRFFALPGVPAEMKEMWQLTVAPRLIQECGAGKRVIRYCSLKCFGIGESEVEVRMPDLIARDRIPRVGITASRATITLRIAAEGETEEECRLQIEPTRQEILERLGQLVFAEGEEELAETVIKQLIKRQQTLVTIEFGAAAFLGQWLSDAQEKLSNQIQQDPPETKRRLIHGPYIGSMNSVALEHLASSILTPRYDERKSKIQEAAAQAWRAMKCDWVLVVGPYPSLQSTSGLRTSEQSKSKQDQAAGHTAYDLDVVVLGENHLKNFNISMSGHPDVIQHRIAKTALDKLRYSLLSESSSSVVGGDPPSDQSRR